MPVLTAEQEQYLRDHRLAVLATGRRDGSPQLSTVLYHYDGDDIAISVTSDRAKWKNAVR
jgi:nitroimidazol reductase NimA-like FMN-containing flavoprotein (pyridoxamine 5'-phosphate oxidase superfamily)